MIKLVCVFVLLAVFINEGLMLTCYIHNQGNYDGNLLSKHPRQLTCGNTIENFKPVCYYKVSYDEHRRMDFVNASCAIMSRSGGSSIQDCTATPYTRVKQCRICDTDLCNFSDHQTVNPGFIRNGPPKCYNCHSSQVHGCSDTRSMSQVQCGHPPAGYKSVCYYKHSRSHGRLRQIDIVNATCALVAQSGGLKPLDCYSSEQGFTVDECRACDTDLCNYRRVY